MALAPDWHPCVDGQARRIGSIEEVEQVPTTACRSWSAMAPAVTSAVPTTPAVETATTTAAKSGVIAAATAAAKSGVIAATTAAMATTEAAPIAGPAAAESSVVAACTAIASAPTCSAAKPTTEPATVSAAVSAPTVASPIQASVPAKAHRTAGAEVRIGTPAPNPRCRQPHPSVAGVVHIGIGGCVVAGAFVGVLVSVRHPNPAVLTRVNPLAPTCRLNSPRGLLLNLRLRLGMGLGLDWWRWRLLRRRRRLHIRRRRGRLCRLGCGTRV